MRSAKKYEDPDKTIEIIIEFCFHEEGLESLFI